MRGSLHWWNAGHNGTYEVEIIKWEPDGVTFMDEKSGKFRKVVMTLTDSKLKLHSGLNNNTNDDWATYVGEFTPKLLKGKWRRIDDVYGGEGEFELTPI